MLSRVVGSSEHFEQFNSDHSDSRMDRPRVTSFQHRAFGGNLMKNTYRHATGGLIALVGVGCSSGAAAPAATPVVPVEKVEQSIQASLDRLNALQVVTSARLVLDLPAEA